MNKEKIITKVNKNWEERMSFILCGKCVIYNNIVKNKEMMMAKKASFLIEASGVRHEVIYGEEDMSKSDKFEFLIFPFSKHRVVVRNQTVSAKSNQWLFGGFDFDDDNMKILGYMDFGVVSVMIYFNSKTETPFIMLEDRTETDISKLMHQALYSLGFKKGKEGEDEFEEL